MISRFKSAFGKFALAAGLAAAAVAVGTFAVPAQSLGPFSSNPFRITHQDGEAIYRNVCAGCHMPDGRGAVGAGAYPALADNAKLAVAVYTVLLVVNGRKAMPLSAATRRRSGGRRGQLYPRQPRQCLYGPRQPMT